MLINYLSYIVYIAWLSQSGPSLHPNVEMGDPHNKC